MHDGDHSIWVFQCKHFTEVIFTCGLLGGAALGGINQLQAKQTCGCDAVLRQVIVALVQIALGQANQHLLIQYGVAIRIKHKQSACRFVDKHHQLVAVLTLHRRDKDFVCFFSAVRHLRCNGFRHFCSDFLCGGYLNRVVQDEGFGWRNATGIEDDANCQDTGMHLTDNFTDSLLDSLGTLFSKQDNVFLQALPELRVALIYAVEFFKFFNLVILQTVDWAFQQFLLVLRNYACLTLDDVAFIGNLLRFRCLLLTTFISLQCKLDFIKQVLGTHILVFGYAFNCVQADVVNQASLV